jgi:hypothetical protein
MRHLRIKKEHARKHRRTSLWYNSARKSHHFISIPDISRHAAALSLSLLLATSALVSTVDQWSNMDINTIEQLFDTATSISLRDLKELGHKLQVDNAPALIIEGFSNFEAQVAQKELKSQ